MVSPAAAAVHVFGSLRGFSRQCDKSISRNFFNSQTNIMLNKKRGNLCPEKKSVLENGL
jgi:hypothetical protein